MRTTALGTAISELATSRPSITAGYDECRLAVNEVISDANKVLSHLLAMQPFAPFDHPAAESLVALTSRRLATIADQIDAGFDSGRDEQLDAAADTWQVPVDPVDVRTTLCQAFGMPEAPIDDTGDFRPEWVLDHYAYRHHELLQRLLPHLASLGVPGLTDALAAVAVCGEVLSCIDPVTAYVEMDSFIGHALAARPETKAEVLQHLARMEPAIRRARTAAGRASRTVRDQTASAESRADALADSYKRLVEGPFRQLAWALFCLEQDAWHPPPTLGVLLDRIVKEGGGLAQVTPQVLIPELRNGEAHETLVWDGFSEHFLVEGTEISPEQVVDSAHLAQCVVAGFEAGLTVVRFLDVPGTPALLPEHNEQGRMPGWRRVQAFFGTNRLRLIRADLNTRHATLHVSQLGVADTNPCFQALVLSHRLMPQVETFLVIEVRGTVVIEVDADALSASMAAWEYAVSNLDQIPLSTFLAANLNARLRHEAEALAIRSAAWIAVDDAVGIIDGSPDGWTSADRDLVRSRLRVVGLALQGVEALLGATSPRIRSVAQSVASLNDWVAIQEPESRHLADGRHEMVRLRTQWENWGPVSRHPLVREHAEQDPSERQPQLRESPGSAAFRLL